MNHFVPKIGIYSSRSGILKNEKIEAEVCNHGDERTNRKIQMEKPDNYRRF